MIGLAACFEQYDFGDGGAFPEIPIFQYPQGHRPAPVGAAGASAALVAAAPQDDAARNGAPPPMLPPASAQIVAKHFAVEELQRADAAEVAANVEETRVALQSALQAQVTHDSAVKHAIARDGAVDADYDPLDPTNTKVARRAARPRLDLSTIDSAAEAPVIRSPTKKDAGGLTVAEARKEMLAHLPTVNNYSNRRGIVYSIEERVAASGGLHEDMIEVSDRHAALSAALEEKAREIDQRAARRVAEAAAAKERDVQVQAEQAQREAAAKLQQRREEQRELRRMEGASREEAAAAHREMHERERDAERQQRRLQKIAQRTGLSIDDVEASGDFLTGGSSSSDALPGKSARDDALAALQAFERPSAAARRGGAGSAEGDDGEEHFDNPLYARPGGDVPRRRRKPDSGDVFGLDKLL